MLFLYIVLYIASIFFYILYRGVFSFYLFGFLTILPIILFCINKYISRRVDVSFMNVQKTAGRSSKIPVVIKAENKTKFPVADMTVEIEYYSVLDNEKNKLKINTPLFPDETQYFTLHISAWHYGTVKMKIKKCTVSDMLKLFKMKLKYPKGEELFRECSFSIFPDSVPIEGAVANYAEMGLETDEYSKTHKGDDPSEIFDIHEYTDGDKISRIHWKISAKQDKTMIKDYSLPIANSIVLLIDLHIEDLGDNFMSDYDTLIECVSSVSDFLISAETPHRAAWYDNTRQELVVMNITDEEDHSVFVNTLLQTPIYNKKDLSLNSFIDSDEQIKCGHLMYFSSVYNENAVKAMDDNELACKYSYMLVCSEEPHIAESSETASVIPVLGGHISESLSDMCF